MYFSSFLTFDASNRNSVNAARQRLKLKPLDRQAYKAWLDKYLSNLQGDVSVPLRTDPPMLFRGETNSAEKSSHSFSCRLAA
jgi:hypothetical protein